MRPALILLDHRDPVGVPAISTHAGGRVNRKLSVVAQLWPWQPLRGIFVIERRPLARKIDLGQRGEYGDSGYHQGTSEDRHQHTILHFCFNSFVTFGSRANNKGSPEVKLGKVVLVYLYPTGNSASGALAPQDAGLYRDGGPDAGIGHRRQ